MVATLYTANSQRAAVSEQSILAEINATRPLSIVMAEKLAALREWAGERAVPDGLSLRYTSDSSFPEFPSCRAPPPWSASSVASKKERMRKRARSSTPRTRPCGEPGGYQCWARRARRKRAPRPGAHRSFYSKCVRPVFVNGDFVVIRWIFDFVFHDGSTLHMEELPYQRWEGERIAAETFFSILCNAYPRRAAEGAERAMRELKLLSSMAPKALLKELAALYGSRSPGTVRLEAAGGVDVVKRVRAGEQLDVVVLARNSIDDLAGEGLLDAASVCDVAVSGIGIAARAGAPCPEVADVESLKRTISAASSLSYSTGPSGVYLEKLFASWGVLQAVKSRIVVPPPGIPVGNLLKEGKVELGFQQLSELIGVEGVTVLGPLPETVQLLTRFSAGVNSRSRERHSAEALVKFMSGGEHAAVRIRFGMQ